MSIEEQIAQILADEIHFSGQTGNYVIHGAIEKIKELIQSQQQEKDELDKLRRDVIYWQMEANAKYQEIQRLKDLLEEKDKDFEDAVNHIGELEKQLDEQEKYIADISKGYEH